MTGAIPSPQKPIVLHFMSYRGFRSVARIDNKVRQQREYLVADGMGEHGEVPPKEIGSADAFQKDEITGEYGIIGDEGIGALGVAGRMNAEK